MHDVSNLLTIVFARVENLEKTSGKKCREDILNVKTNLEKIRILLLSAKQQLNFDEESCVIKFFPVDEIKSAIEAVEIKAHENGVKLETDLDKKLVLKGDPVKFYQIVLNLLLNAVESFETGKKLIKNIIKVSLYKRKRNLVLDVEDNGKGISSQRRNQIFKPFYTTKKKTGGTGIGLFLSKEYSEKYFCGKLSFKSYKSSGTIFTLEIPLDSG